jgi:ABC-2 type transport system permease protein
MCDRLWFGLRLIGRFIVASVQEQLAYRANSWISLVHSLLNLGTGVMGVIVLFSQAETVKGWTFPSALALLGVYLTLSALRGLFIGPSLDALAGMDGAVWTGQFDFTLLRPVDVQFQASFGRWRPLAGIDMALGLGVVIVAALQLGETVPLGQVAAFVLSLSTAALLLYAILLAFTGLVFWNPTVLYTWLFNAVFQMARYPVGLYPGWLRLVMTWVVPVGVMTTIPAQALTGGLPVGALAGSAALSAGFLAGATVLFRTGLRRYASASS